MRKILMISFRFPYPEHKGGFNLRILKFAKMLSNEYSVDLLTLVESKKEMDKVEELKRKNIFNNVFYFYHSQLREYLQALKGVFSGIPLQVGYYFSKEAVNWLESNYKNYDLLYFNTIRTVEWGRCLKRIPKVVDLIDSVSLNYSEARKWNKSFFWKSIYNVEIPRLRKFERKLIKSGDFQKYFITSEFDKNHLLSDLEVQDSKDKVVVVPNGVREDLLKMDSGESSDYILSFFGKMDTQPNQDAVVFFAKKVFPSLKEKFKKSIGRNFYPRLLFYIIGVNPSAKVEDLGEKENIKVTGFLENPYDLLLKSKIVVVPLRFGAGVQNKVLEAMALGKPVLTSPIGKRGIKEAEEGKHIEVVEIDKPDLWVEKSLNLLLNSKKRKELGDKDRKLIRNNYRWPKIGKELVKQIDAVAQQ